MTDNRKLPQHKVEELALFYERGIPISRTADLIDVPKTTVWRYFRRFYAQGLPRRAVHRNRYETRDATLPPEYTGPAIIGVATTEPPEPIGSEWIGKAMP